MIVALFYLLFAAAVLVASVFGYEPSRVTLLVFLLLVLSRVESAIFYLRRRS